MAAPFSVVSVASHPFGILALVSLSDGRRPVPDEDLARLDAGEAAVARSLTGYRQADWVGGRLAARAAAENLKAAHWTLLRGSSGEPRPPAGFVVSVSHKRDLAAAIVARSSGMPPEGLGIDLEDDASAACAAASIVLVPEERAALEGLPTRERERAFLLAFALKECVYKALAVPLGRPLEYREAFVRIDAESRASVTLALECVSEQPEIEVHCEWLGARVIASVRIKTRAQSRRPSSSGR